MRDVVNKNVTEAHIEESSRRVFSRGWHRLKLYFMIGLPTEEDDDVRGIVETGLRMLKVGRGLVGHRAEVTVSVSSHVPKPHTPLQWAQQDSFAEIERKQAILRQTARNDRSLRLKHHHSGISFVEGVLARGDRRLAPVIEAVWRAGARFDGWDECFDLERWSVALAEHGIDATTYLATRPVTARLPWDHIDVGLEDGFLLSEYRKAVKGRASPPCGKVAGMLIHHTNLAEAEPDRRKLVCYDCGVACDLSKMRDDRLVALRVLGATERPASREVPVDAAAELVDVSERGGGSPAELGKDRETDRAERVRLAGHHGAGATYSTYRIRFAKVGRAAFLGHLDLVRLIARTLRRADLPLAMTRGFSPKPRLVFGPALGLGVPSLGEMMDIDLEHTVPGKRTWEVADDDTARIELPPDEVKERIAAVCPPGLEIESCAIVRLPGHVLAKHKSDPGLGKLINAVDVLVRPAADGIAHDAARLERLAAAFLAKPTCLVARGGNSESKKPARDIDVRALVTEVSVIADDAAAKLCGALDWPVAPALFRIRVRATAEGSAKPSELAKALGVWGSDELRGDHALVARLGVVTDPAPHVTSTREPYSVRPA
jgi:radical SAM-linked protein